MAMFIKFNLISDTFRRLTVHGNKENQYSVVYLDFLHATDVLWKPKKIKGCP